MQVLPEAAFADPQPHTELNQYCRFDRPHTCKMLIIHRASKELNTHGEKGLLPGLLDVSLGSSQDWRPKS